MAPVLTPPAQKVSGTAESLSQPPGPSLLLQLELLSKQKQSLEAELQRCQGAEQEAKERARRWEAAVAMTTRVGPRVPSASAEGKACRDYEDVFTES